VVTGHDGRFSRVILLHQGVFETDDEVNADLLAFIKEAIIAIRGRLQAWSTRGERHD